VFIDETTITAKAGDGGNGCYAHERSRARPFGKPSGGNGGLGGHVYIEGSSQLHTLQDIAYQHTFRAKRGAHGKGSTKDGRHGEDVTIRVPLGTIVIDAATEQVLIDCIENQKSVIVAHGGKGGRGNHAMKSPKNPDPDHAEYGHPGEERRCRLVLKVLADVGLVGRPNAGKSTFLSKISHAHPKIADYPFTTLHPHLGIVKFSDSYDSFVVADLPGLIEGSHEGKGLGIRFLRHIERTRILALLIDASDPDPRQTAATLIHELEQYSPLLAAKPKCYILSKSDLIPLNERPDLPEEWLTMSAVTGNNIAAVLNRLRELLTHARGAETIGEVNAADR
jgi:GTP-binding protein